MLQGKKTAKPKLMRFVKSSKKGTEGIQVLFNVEGEDISWTGWLTDKTHEKTVEALNLMGWNGDQTLDANSNFSHPNVLNWDGEVQLTIDIESFQDENGNTHKKSKISWINRVGGSGFEGISPQEAKSSAGMMFLKTAAIQGKKELKNYAPQSAPPPPEVPDEKIPF